MYVINKGNQYWDLQNKRWTSLPFATLFTNITYDKVFNEFKSFLETNCAEIHIIHTKPVETIEYGEIEN